MLMISENAYVNTHHCKSWNVQSNRINAKICTVFIYFCYFLLLLLLFLSRKMRFAHCICVYTSWLGMCMKMCFHSFETSLFVLFEYVCIFVFIRYFKWILLFVVKCWWCAKYLMLMSMVHEMCIDISAPFAFCNNIIKNLDRVVDGVVSLPSSS